MNETVVALIIIFCIPALCVAAQGCAKLFLKTGFGERFYCVFPVGKATENIEIRLMGIAERIGMCETCCFTVIIVNFDMSQLNLEICEKFCADNPSFILAKPEALLSLLKPYDCDIL